MYSCTVCAWPQSIQIHREAQTLSNVAGFPLVRKMSSFFPSSVWPDERNKKKNNKKTQPIKTSSLARLLDHLHKGNYLLPLTLWMLQPATVRVVEVTTLKLLLTIVGHWHWDKRVHAVEAPLKSKTKTRRQYTDTGLVFWNFYGGGTMQNRATADLSQQLLWQVGRFRCVEGASLSQSGNNGASSLWLKKRTFIKN